MFKYIFKSPVLQLGLIHSLGGSGGTLLTQCLSTMSNVFFLSECNPLSANLFEYQLNPYIQLKNWHPELYRVIEKKFNENKLTKPKKFSHFLKLLNYHLNKKNQHLIVRDYNYIDYIGLPFISAPPMYSSLMSAIKKNFVTQHVVLVRHPLTQYNSLRSHAAISHILTPDHFIEGYLKFLKDFSQCYWVKYEDIVANPKHYIANICETLQIPYSEEFINKFHKQSFVTGNFNRIHEKEIVLSNRQLLKDIWMEDLKKHPKFNLLISKLGY